MASSGPPGERGSLPTEQVQGIVERVTFHSEESGYTVARFQMPSAHDLLTIVGNFPDIHAGQTLRLGGYYREHAKYGQQFHVVWAQETKPATLTGLEKYLGSGLIKGIGPVTAKRIVKHFGLETLEVIEQSCSRLIEVPSIGERRVGMIERAWAAQKAIKDVMLFLRGHDVSTVYAVKIYKVYGDKAIEIVSKNPYQLATDIYGIGFITADIIARKLGIVPDSDFRYQAGLLYVLSQAGEEGHCFLPVKKLVEHSTKRLALPVSFFLGQDHPGGLSLIIVDQDWEDVVCTVHDMNEDMGKKRKERNFMEQSPYQTYRGLPPLVGICSFADAMRPEPSRVKIGVTGASGAFADDEMERNIDTFRGTGECSIYSFKDKRNGNSTDLLFIGGDRGQRR